MSYKSNIDFSAFSDSMLKFMRTIYPMILKKLRYSDTMSEYLTVINSTEGIYVLPNSQITSLLQGYQTDATAKGKVTLDAEVVEIKRYKLDFPYDPVEFYDRYESHLQQNDLRPSQHPLEAFILNEVLEKYVEDIQINAAKGLWKQPIDGVATQGKHSFNGYLTELRRLIKEGKVIPVKTGSFTASTIVSYLEDFADDLEDLYQMKKMVLLSSIKNSRAYSKDYRADFGSNNGINDSKVIVKELFDTGMNIVGDSSLAGENIFIATPKENMMRINSIRNNKPLDAQKLIRTHWILGDGGLGFGYGLPSIVFVAGQVITPPTARVPLEADIAATTASVKFEEVPGATGYRVDVDNNADFSSPVIDDLAIDLSSLAAVAVTLADGTVSREYLLTAALTGLTSGTTYYARLRAEIQVESSVTKYTSENSNVVSFETA